jgi:DNA-binding CsgD family transcriptional regulator
VAYERPTRRDVVTGRGSDGSAPLLGRDAEIAVIDQTVRGAQPGGRVLVAVGEAGTGKSELLRLARAYAPGGRTVLVQGSELEADLGFAGLTQLVRQLRRELAGLAETQRAVLAHVTSTGRPAVGDRFAVGVALLELFAHAAHTGPLVVLVDDVQWLDAATVEALAFAARRLDRDPVRLVLASRRPVPSAVADLPPLPLAGLDTHATGALLARVSGCPVTTEVVEAVQHDTGGIPLAVVELGRTLRPEQLAGVEPLDHPLPVGERLERAYARRVAALPPVVRRALVILAAAGGGGSAGLARLGVPQADLAPAEAAGLVGVEGGRVAFRHPVIRSACYHGASGPDRRRAHRLLAQADPAADVSAWHLAHATVGVDDRAAADLARVGRRAQLRHAHAEASRALRRAAELTSDQDRAAELLVAAAAEQRLGGRLDQAGQLLDEASRLSRDDMRACQVVQERARIALFRGHPMSTHAMLVGIAGRVAGTDPDRAADLLLDAVFPAILAGESTQGFAAAWRAAAICGESDPRVALALGVSAAEALSEAESLRHLRRAAAGLSGRDAAAAVPHAGLAALGLALHGALAEAMGLISESIASLRAQGMVGLLPFPLAVSSILAFWAGHWPESQVSGDEASRLAYATGHGTDLAAVLGLFVAAGLGREPDCRAAAARAGETMARTGNAGLRCWLHAALGKLELGLGRFERAVYELDQAFVDQTPGAVPEWQADRVEALWRSGRCTEAAEASDRLWAWAARNRQPMGVAFAARSQLLVTGDHELDRWWSAGREAFETLRRPFEQARLALIMGERQRRARRLTEARADLRAALVGFERLGAAPWASRAAAELRAAGGGVPGADRNGGGAADVLTPQELQVTVAVAGGATNREVARRLLLSPKTVAYHLNRAYRKLGVRNRVELARALGDRVRSTDASVAT